MSINKKIKKTKWVIRFNVTFLIINTASLFFNISAHNYLISGMVAGVLLMGTISVIQYSKDLNEYKRQLMVEEFLSDAKP